CRIPQFLWTWEEINKGAKDQCVCETDVRDEIKKKIDGLSELQPIDDALNAPGIRINEYPPLQSESIATLLGLTRPTDKCNPTTKDTQPFPFYGITRVWWGDLNPSMVTISVKVTPPKIIFSDFTPDTQTVTIESGPGAAVNPLIIKHMAIIGQNPDVFRIESTDCGNLSFPQKCTVKIRYLEAPATNRRARLCIIDNAVDNPQYVLLESFFTIP